MGISNVKQSTTRFFKEVKVEMEKVSWPSQSEIRDMTVAVIIATIILSLFVFGVDKVIAQFVQILFGWG